MKYAHALLGIAFISAVSERAHADVSSWAYVGSGATSLEQRDLDRRTATTMAIETGLGSAPSNPLVVGGMFKLLALFGDGADVGLSARVAMRSFVTGGFGLALDGGPYQRFWGDGSTGGHAALVLGAPWGITLSLNGAVGSRDARLFGATLGLDFARLTVYRLHGESWFPNPHAPYRAKD